MSDVLAELAALTDLDAREPLEDELLGRFDGSPEAQGLSNLHACGLVMDFAANYFGVTVARLGPTELREILCDRPAQGERRYLRAASTAI